MAGLEVTIGADSSELDKEIKATEAKIRSLAGLKIEKIKLGANTKELNIELAEARLKLQDLKKELKETGSAVQKDLTPKIANGGNTLMQFNRIVQDAPFGIIGMGNNITASVEAFGHLSKSSGGAGEALKAIGSSLLGTGGVIAAFSLVTTGLTYMAQNGLTVKDVFDKLTGTFNENARAMSALAAESRKSSGDEIANMNALVSIAKTRSNSDEERLAAVKKLQDEYPAYFGNLSKEAILNGDVAGAVKEVAKALIAKAEAAALSGKLAELSEKEFLLREKETKAINDYKKALKSVNESSQQFQSGGGVMGATGVSNIGTLKATESALLDVQNELRAVISAQRLYTSELEKTLKTSTLFDQKNKEAAASAPKPKKVNTNEPITPFAGSLLDTAGLASTFNMASTIITTGMDKAKVAFDMGGVGIMESLIQLDNDIKNLIETSLAGTLSDLGTVIGEALATGGNVFKAMGNSLLLSMGKFLGSMGDLLIQYGTLAVLKGKLDTAILAGGPVAIGAGLAAIAAGVALKAVSGAISSKVQSQNSNGGNYDTGANYSSPASGSSYTSGGSSYGSGTVVFEIDGQKLVGVLSNTLGRNSKLGGSLGI